MKKKDSKPFEDPLGKPFVFPEAILKMIEECSPAGYLLFYLDGAGMPLLRANFSSQVTEIGLRSYAQKLLNSISQVETGDMANNLFNKLHREDEEESEENN